MELWVILTQVGPKDIPIPEQDAAIATQATTSDRKRKNQALVCLMFFKTIFQFSKIFKLTQ